MRARTGMKKVSGFLVVSMVAGLMTLAGPARAARTFWVHPGQSIQAAVDRAAPGDTVVVLKGVYAETVQVRTDYLTLRGRHAVIVPPTQVPDTPCTTYSAPTGICLFAKDGDPPSGVVTTPVVGDTIQGFTIRGFSGPGIYTFGAYGALIKYVRAWGNDEGVSSWNSSGIKFIDNLFARNGSGIFLDNIGGGRDQEPPPLPEADALIHGNYFHANGSGVYVVNTSVGTIRGNEFAGNGEGVWFRAGFSGAVKSWTIKWNYIHDGSTGMRLEGVRYFRIVHNRVVDSYGDGEVYSGGLVLMEAADYDGADSSYNVIEHNTFLRNQLLDIFWETAANGGQPNGNIFADNLCERSLPESVCS